MADPAQPPPPPPPHQSKGERRAEADDWVTGKERGERDQTTYYADVRLLAVCQSGGRSRVTPGRPIPGGEMGPLMTSTLARHESRLHEGAFR